MNVSKQRLETLVIARAFTLRDEHGRHAITSALVRFAPAHMTPAEWQRAVEETIDALSNDALDGAGLRDRSELARRIGTHRAASWLQLADRILPALALRVAPDDTKTLSKLRSAEAWAAAIVSRVRGIWTEGAPPSASTMCDAFAWQRLGLGGKPKRLPAEVRALFLQQELASGMGKHERLLRQLAARELGVPRTDARSLRDGLVRCWLAERDVGARGESFATQVAALARSAREGVFGDRKVFIAELWRQLTRNPQWAAVTLEDFKSRLLAAHASGDVVLARADLVSAMNPDLVAASETVTNGASFHFVVREP